MPRKRVTAERAKSGYKKVPSYWWDFDGDDSIIVESDNPRYKIVGRFKYDPRTGVGCALPAIKQAEKLKDDLETGRVLPRSVK